jgi:hypothetical protein
VTEWLGDRFAKLIHSGSNPFPRSMKKIRLEILESSYWEHYKYAKDMAMYLPLDHPKRKLLEKELNEMISELNILKAELNKE